MVTYGFSPHYSVFYIVPPLNTISIVIPALNEESGIRETITEIPLEELRRLGFDVEVIVVDGDSIDGTRKIAEDLKTRVIIEKRLGYGRAYKTGFEKAFGDIIVTLDADSSYPASYIPELVYLLINKNLDFISTNRFSSMEKEAMSVLNYIGNKMITLVTRLLFSIDIRDSQSGMWVFKKKILDDIVLEGEGMEFSEEIKIKTFNKFHAIEVPIVYRRRKGSSKIKYLSDGLKNLLFLIKLRFDPSRKPQRGF